jgi:LEA14-like dessication related protein
MMLGRRGNTLMKRFVLLLSFLVTGCSLFMSKPEIAVKGVNITGIDRYGVEMDFQLAVTNQNSYKLKLTGYNYNLLLSSLPMANGENHEIVEFPGNTTTDVRLPVRITFHDLLEILKLRPDPEHIPYRLIAGLNLCTPFSAIAIPVDKSGTFAVPQKYRPDRFLKQLDELFNNK